MAKSIKQYSMEEWLGLSARQRSDLTSVSGNGVVPDPGRESLTKASDAADADINNLVRRFGGLRSIPVLDGKVPQFGDFSSVKSLQSAMQLSLEAERVFKLYPAEVRARFDNSAAQFYDFVVDPSKFDEAVALKVINAPKGYLSPAERKAAADAAAAKAHREAVKATLAELQAEPGSSQGPVPGKA